MTSSLGTPLKLHKQKVKELKQDHAVYDLEELKTEVMDQKFHCRKYNYNMDIKVQNYEHQKAYIKIENKGKYFALYNSKISEKMNYILEADPAVLEEKRIEHKSMKKIKYGDDVEKDPDVSIRHTKSSASCSIKDIQLITFGGFSTRFWALRKHINCLQDDQMDNLPFYSW